MQGRGNSRKMGDRRMILSWAIVLAAGVAMSQDAIMSILWGKMR